MLSRAAAQLCSRGLAPHTENTALKLERLFPPATHPLGSPPPEAPTFTIEPETVRKLILQTLKWLAPVCFGLRAEHLKSLLFSRNIGLSSHSLSMLTAFVNQSLNGYLQQHLQPHLCGGRLIPLIKKDAAVRPLVVGELLRALVSKLRFEISNVPTC